VFCCVFLLRVAYKWYIYTDDMRTLCFLGGPRDHSPEREMKINTKTNVLDARVGPAARDG
jgi:hypothetical protein